MIKWNRFEINYDFINEAVLKFEVIDTLEDEDGKSYLRADIKFSGCSDFWFGKSENNPGHIHICMYNDFLLHVQLIKKIYRIAYEEFDKNGKRFDGMYEWDDGDLDWIEQGGTINAFGHYIEGANNDTN